MIELNLPVDEKQIRSLKVGDEVSITGTMVTARDAAHKYMVEQNAEEVRGILKGGMIYHCGPVVRKEGENWSFVAAGPTTSIREEPYEAKVIADYGVRAVIGKGGMGANTLKACGQHGCVYLHAIGGMGTILAQCVKRVRTVYKLEEFGPPEAFWVIEVEKFPAVVTMDSHGGNLHKDIEETSSKRLKELLGV